MEQSPSREANSHLAGQEIPRLLWDQCSQDPTNSDSASWSYLTVCLFICVLKMKLCEKSKMKAVLFHCTHHKTLQSRNNKEKGREETRRNLHMRVALTYCI